MNYMILKMKFPMGVHFGDTSLEDGLSSFYADTLCSALFQEAYKMGQETGDQLYTYIKNDQLLLSDALPYADGEYYIPKPFVKIVSAESMGDSSLKKAYKKLQYICVDELPDYTAGNYNMQKQRAIDELGKFEMKVSASVRGEEETKPYRVGTYYFNEGNGLYVIVGYETPEIEVFVTELMDRLSLSGIGGKRSSGLGRFELIKRTIPEQMNKCLQGDGSRYMSLSISLPTDSEMDNVIQDALFMVKKRSGFVDSFTYAGEQRRKKDLFMFTSGAVFTKSFSGDLYDVSDGGNHPVYRYGKPILIHIDRPNES